MSILFIICFFLFFCVVTFCFCALSAFGFRFGACGGGFVAVLLLLLFWLQSGPCFYRDRLVYKSVLKYLDEEGGTDDLSQDMNYRSPLPFSLCRPQEGDACPNLPQDGPGGPGLEAGV